jgi:eukaryotic-like serine/threonine-protein kinase
MSLANGTKLGPYEILSPLGAGGMGEVYRARDTKLAREVALKVLPEGFAADGQRMARFEREAQLLAALNHPHIAAIYGLEESGGTRALVMELVEGPTLAERILQGPIAVDEALPLARQVAEALEYAHERGIVHRDLKPANLKVTPDGAVKVLDFGIAKALEDGPATADISSSPTLTAAATRAGVILGTAPYMSPEQARGKTIDRRTDIWSFGCVLFQMLTAKLAFPGETVSDTLAAVITKEPEWSRLPAATPPRLRELLRRCLQKDPRKRLQSMGDARLEIEELLTLGGAGNLYGLEEQSGRPAPRSFLAWSPVLLGMALIFVILSGLAGWWLHSRTVRTSTWTGELLGGSDVAFGPRISPDGRTLAFQAMIDNLTQVAVANPDTGNWTLLTHDRTHGLVNEISWSPDGSKLYFDRVLSVPKGIYSVPALGGAERLVLENAGTPEALPDGSLLVTRYDPDGRLRICHYWPDSERLDPLSGWVTLGTTVPLRAFPDGKEAVFLGMVGGSDISHLYAMEIATGKTRRLAPDLPIVAIGEGYPLAPTPDNLSVLIDTPAGDLHRIVAVPRSGKGPLQTVTALTKAPWYMDTEKDGSLYLDQLDRPHEILRFPRNGGSAEVIAHSDPYVEAGGDYMEPVETTDGRFILDTRLSERERLLIGRPDTDFLPLLDTNEETSGPATSLGNGEVAFILGSGAERVIALASTAEGRVIRRLQGTKGRRISGLAASPDGKTLYYVSDGGVWAVSESDGTPRRIAAGDKVSADPNGRELIVTLNERSGAHLVRVLISDGTTHEIPVDTSLRLAPVALGSHAVAEDGKILIPISPPDSWFYRLVILDPATGHASKVPVSYTGDTIVGNWTGDGRILAIGLPLRSHVWRFRHLEERRQ